MIPLPCYLKVRNFTASVNCSEIDNTRFITEAKSLARLRLRTRGARLGEMYPKSTPCPGTILN
jgi:hypothetical protein